MDSIECGAADMFASQQVPQLPVVWVANSVRNVEPRAAAFIVNFATNNNIERSHPVRDVRLPVAGVVSVVLRHRVGSPLLWQCGQSARESKLDATTTNTVLY